MTKFYLNINKGDLILVSRWEQGEFDGVVGMIAKRDIESQCSPIGSTVGWAQGYGRCIMMDMDDFEPLGDFYGLTGHSIFMGEGLAVAHEHLVVPDHIEWVVKNAPVRW